MSKRRRELFQANRDTCAVRLSRRQEQCVAGIFHGLSNAAIAAELGMIEQCVKNTLGAALRKLGVADRHELVGQAWKFGGLALWLYTGEEQLEQQPARRVRFATAAAKRAAEARARAAAWELDRAAAEAEPELEAIARPWLSHFPKGNDPTTHEIRLLDLFYEDPDRDAAGLARLMGSRSTTHAVQMMFARIYDKAGVRSRAGLMAFLLRGQV